MKNQVLPIVIIVASLGLITFNVVTSEEFDKGFWMRNLSSILLIAAMFFVLKSKRKEKEDNSN